MTMGSDVLILAYLLKPTQVCVFGNVCNYGFMSRIQIQPLYHQPGAPVSDRM